MSTGRVAAAALIAACVVWAVGVRAAAAQAVPPKTIADILALLEQEKPDPAKLAKLRAETDSEPPVPAGASDLIEFYFRRSEARQVAGRHGEARADVDKALSIDRSSVDPRLVLDVRGHAAWLYRNAGQPHKCVQAFKEMERDVDRPGFKGRLFAHLQKSRQLPAQHGRSRPDRDLCGEGRCAPSRSQGVEQLRHIRPDLGGACARAGRLLLSRQRSIQGGRAKLSAG